jgi:hypothetical protein
MKLARDLIGLGAGDFGKRRWAIVRNSTFTEYSIDRGQQFQAIVDSDAKSAASAADSSQVSTMG